MCSACVVNICAALIPSVSLVPVALGGRAAARGALAGGSAYHLHSASHLSHVASGWTWCTSPHPSLGLGLVLRGASESGVLLFRNPPLGTGDVGVMVEGGGLELCGMVLCTSLSKGGVGSPEMIHGT